MQPDEDEMTEFIRERKRALGLEDADLPPYFVTILDLCKEEGIKTTILSNNWVLKLEKSGATRFIIGYKFGLNNQAAACVADDKYAAFCVLKDAGLPVFDHEICYASCNGLHYAAERNTPEYVADYLHSHNNSIVIKPCNGNSGRAVQHITRELEIPDARDKVFFRSHSAVICPFLEVLHEYRTIVLDNEVRLVYQKTRTDDADWRFNLKQGAISEDITDEKMRAQLVRLAKRAAAAIGLRFCSVDIIETMDHEIFIIEVNSGVTIKRYLVQHPEQYDLVKSIYRDAIQKLFAAE